MSDTTFDESMHSSKKVSVLIIMAEIVGWILLAIYLLIFISDVKNDLIPNFAMYWPKGDTMGQLVTIASILFKPAIGFFYFTILHSLAQLLALGTDIFFNTDMGMDEEDTIMAEFDAASDEQETAAS